MSNESQIESHIPPSKTTGTIIASPNPIIVSDPSGLGSTNLVWTSHGTETVEVHIEAPDGPLFVRSGSSGSRVTGPWAKDGMIFCLQDVSDGKPLISSNTLSTVTLHAEWTGDPEIGRLMSLPRYQPTVTEICGMPIEIVDAHSFLGFYPRCFVDEIHCFQTDRQDPYIIDAGANIGVSVLYFKKIYPRSEIVAFEPDPRIFEVLERNIRRNGCVGVTLVCAALASTESKAMFLSEGSWGGRIARTGDPSNQTVSTTRLRKYLDRKVDLLKLSIEGAEGEVLEDCKDLLGNVERLVVDYHSFAGEPQKLHLIVGILAAAGFRLHLKQFASSSQPFIRREQILGKDQVLYIYAFRS